MAHLDLPESVRNTLQSGFQDHALGYPVDESTVQWSTLHFLRTLQEIFGSAAAGCDSRHSCAQYAGEQGRCRRTVC